MKGSNKISNFKGLLASQSIEIPDSEAASIISCDD